MTKNLLGTQGKTILQNLAAGNNVLVSALPGMGLYTFIKAITSEYCTSQKAHVITIYPHETYTLTSKDYDFILFEKFLLENTFEHKTVYKFTQLLSRLNSADKKLLIVCHKIHDFRKLPTFLTYLNSLSRANDSITLLLSVNHGFYVKNMDSYIKPSTKCYTFAGFIETFDTVFEKLLTQFSLPSTVKKQKDTLFNYAFGHAGLIKSMLEIYKYTGSLPSYEGLLINQEIVRRLAEIFRDLANANIPFSIDSTNKQRGALTELGLYYDGKYPKLLTDYYLTKEYKLKTVFEILTTSEKAIFRILNDTTKKYLSLDELAFLLGEKKYESVSDWGLYKHINNMNAKLKPLGLEIKNKRGQGYYLTDSEQLK